MNKFPLIAIEGSEAVGKSTLIDNLCRRFDLYVFHEPGGTAAGELIRSFLKGIDFQENSKADISSPAGLQLCEQLLSVDHASVTEDFLEALLTPGKVLPNRNNAELSALEELYLFNIARAELFEEHILPALENQTPVLLDRHIHSTLAYQGYGQGLDLFEIENVCDIAVRGVRPGLVICLDLAEEKRIQRLANRFDSKDIIENRDTEFFNRVAEGFLQLAAADPSILVIDADRDPQTVADQASAAISELIDYS
jgi:dTMP kinase